MTAFQVFSRSFRNVHSLSTVRRYIELQSRRTAGEPSNSRKSFTSSGKPLLSSTQSLLPVHSKRLRFSSLLLNKRNLPRLFFVSNRFDLLAGACLECRQDHFVVAFIEVQDGKIIGRLDG